MSVAFRRESDEEHLEPKFELPIPPGPNLVTPRGLTLVFAGANGAHGFGLDPSAEAVAQVLDGIYLDAGIGIELQIGPQSRMAAIHLATSGRIRVRSLMLHSTVHRAYPHLRLRQRLSLRILGHDDPELWATFSAVTAFGARRFA